MASRIWILFVDRGRQHSDRAYKQFPVFFRRFLQLLDVLFDVAGHFVEIFGQLADFRGAAHRRALMEFASADGWCGRGKTPCWAADADREKVADDDGDQDNDADERKRLAVQVRKARVVACFAQASLDDYSPVELA